MLRRRATLASAAMPEEMNVSQSEYETLASFRYSLRRFLRFNEEMHEPELP